MLEQQLQFEHLREQPAPQHRAAAASSGSNPLSAGAASGTVVIGSANFPENEVLAEVYALALQAKGVKVTTKLNIGAREVYYPQVEKGAITIIPEYNGTLLSRRGRQDLHRQDHRRRRRRARRRAAVHADGAEPGHRPRTATR